MGLQFSFFFLFLVWVIDIFVYFIGWVFGGFKFWEWVLLKKIWLGVIGGLVFVVFFGVLVVVVFGGSENFVVWGVLVVVLLVVFQVGDLLELVVKWWFDVKDFS